MAQSLFTSSRVARIALLTALISAASAPAWPQAAGAEDSNKDIADSVRELRTQVEELRAAVADMKAEASQYRTESEQLRGELQALRTELATQNNAVTSTAAATPPTTTAEDQRLSALEDTTQVLQSEVRTQYQSKLESASKYRVRFSGLVLVNLFGNRGAVDNLDIPTYAAATAAYGSTSTFGATVRQSELGFEVFGPQIAGAKTSGEVHFDFGGGFPAAAIDGINTGLVRLRTADVRLDWDHTSVIIGQDNLFISPGSPTSFASLVIPSLGYSGNLWAWTPQIRIEHKVDLTPEQNLIFQAGILDNITGERSYSSIRQGQAGESSGQPAYAVRTGWSELIHDRPMSVGVSGYYSRQDWGNYRQTDGWAISGDLRVPLGQRLELSGEMFRGRSIGGLGGAVGQSVIFSGDPSNPGSLFRPVNAIGGWSQLKYTANSKLEFNGAFGLDNPFSSDIHAFASPIGPYQTVIAANRSEMVNFIFRPRADLLLSGEYRHLRTNQLNILNTADQVNLTMGVLF